VIWGFLSGVAQCLYRATAPIRKKIPGTPWVNALNILLTFHFFCFIAVIFRAGDIGAACRYLGYIFTLHRGIRFVSFCGIFGLALVWGAHLAALAKSRRLGIRPTGYYPLVSLGSFTGLLAFFLFLGITVALAYTGQSPFIYFQF
jgi:alginate O-acetyltransferase complex protein AlgI